MPDKTPLQLLSDRGQSVWLDYLSRQILENGHLAEMMERDAVVGVTSNPTIFQKAIAEGDAYDEQLRDLLEHEQDAKEIFLALSAEDVKQGCKLLRTAWDGTKGLDGYVSWEVDPDLAFDRDGTIEEAKRLHDWIDEPNLYVKIPATDAGLGAIEESTANGISINVTLIFGLERHRQVIEAYIRGLERFVESGGDPSQVYSVASFFVSRVDTEADKRLEAIGSEEALALRGRLAIANAKLAYRQYQELFATERWQALEAKGAHPQRCLWASTSTKNPEYRDVLYVEELIGPDTVNTMPEETIVAFQDHGRVADTLTEGVDDAERLLEELKAAGIDYDDVTRVLEEEGVQKFSVSFRELKQGIAEKRNAFATA
jgi:transaldolase